MSRYEVLAKVEIRHEYFRSGKLAGLRLVPTGSTLHALKNLDLLFRPTPAGFTVLTDVSRQEALLSALRDDSDDVDLVFAAVADPAFTMYTAGIEGTAESSFFFSNRTERSPVDGVVPLHDGEHASADDMPQPGDRLPALTGSVSRPDFVVSLGLDTFTEPLTATGYSVSFAARHTWWKYLLLGTAPGEKFDVVDADEQMGFTFAGKERLGDDSSAVTFVSDQPIPLRERYSIAPLLRTGEPPNQRVLIRHLPVAGTDCIASTSMGDDAVLVSEMYVNY